MAFPAFTKTDLSDFSGRPESSYRAFHETALKQAALLFRIRTGLTELPADEDDAELATNAILALADDFVLKQPHAKVAANPFTSESIGSYSYGKTAAAIKRGDDTGVMWFDLAVERLAIGDEAVGVAWGSIGVFEDDLKRVEVSENKTRVLGPQDYNRETLTGSWAV